MADGDIIFLKSVGFPILPYLEKHSISVHTIRIYPRAIYTNNHKCASTYNHSSKARFSCLMRSSYHFMRCACGNILVHGKRRHASTVSLHKDKSVNQCLRCGEGSVEIHEMGMAAVRTRGLTSYELTCQSCNCSMRCTVKGNHLYVHPIDEGMSDSGRRFTIDEPRQLRSLLSNFPLSLRKFLIPAKSESRSVAASESLLDDVIDLEFDSRDWLTQSFTPHILLTELIH